MKKRQRHNDVVISAKNVSKKFCKHLRRSMAYGISDLAKNLFGFHLDTETLRRDEFWAVDDLSFQVRKGEIVGVIGVNGSGKTTLLRLLAGIFPPDKGEIWVKGRVGALIAVGAGFHPHMTGRENIYLNGTILGMTRVQIDRKFDDIVDFAEIEDFLNAPVSTYSSGMRVRLGFAIAAHLEMDVLLIDEVLAVGDAAFRIKCYEKISQLIDEGSTIVFVSHDTQAIKSYCTKVMYFRGGKLVEEGTPSTVVESYWFDIRSKQTSLNRKNKNTDNKQLAERKKHLNVRSPAAGVINAFFVKTNAGDATFVSGEKIAIQVDAAYSNTLKKPSLGIIVQNQKLIVIGGNYVYLPKRSSGPDLSKATISVAFPAVLAEGDYVITFRLEDRLSEEHFLPVEKKVGALSLKIIDSANTNLLGMVDFRMQCRVD